MITPSDLIQIEERQLTKAKIEEQLLFFKKGVPFIAIKSVASVEKGIRRLTAEQQGDYIRAWDAYVSQGTIINKFIPASGAASRMFKDLMAFLSAPNNKPETAFEKTFFDGITHFAFFDILNDCCIKNEGRSVSELIDEGRYKDVVINLIDKNGLNYGFLPKGLILFHKYPESVRTAIEEHLVESALYAKDKDNNVAIHFTVSPEHLPLFKELVFEKQPVYENFYKVHYDISFSLQQPHTDTIAVDMNNESFRDDNGRLVFRPGGHGALIENLNKLDADVVFVKNIDNVATDALKEVTVRLKKTLAGVLITLQKRIFDYLRLIKSGGYTHNQVEEMIYFLQNELCIKNPETKYLEDAELILYIKQKLNRPLRVCGMVKNTGEPGGGPFLAVNPDGTVSPQILEQAQIDMSDPEVKRIFKQSTHFNPVDLVCGLRDVNGKKFHLPDYVDKNAVFISEKSKDGRALRALEWPGLWNGAMSDWNTIFVEVPVETFCPVKTVNDLLN